MFLESFVVFSALIKRFGHSRLQACLIGSVVMAVEQLTCGTVVRSLTDEMLKTVTG